MTKADQLAAVFALNTTVFTPPRLDYIDGDTWKLVRAFRVYSTVAGRQITVPGGLVTDFNSVPRLLTRILPRAEYGEAAVLHDFLYREGKLHGKPITRDFADRVHREFVLWKGAPTWKANAMYLGLKAGGFVAWNRYRAAQGQVGRVDV